MKNLESQLPHVEIVEDTLPGSGLFNMAMDAALLQLGATRDTSVVRVYRWESPTVTLGYFQATAGKEVNPFPQLECVRRLSGGGAILHDQEITYSCVIPASHPVREDPSRLYEIVHRRLIRLLQECGVPCCLRSELKSPDCLPERKLKKHPETDETPRDVEPFLCFLRSNPNDIVHLSGTKIVGSAQRRRKGVILQHGSILLSASVIARDLAGIEQLCKSFNRHNFESHFAASLAGSLGAHWRFRTYTNEELATSKELEGSVSQKISSS